MTRERIPLGPDLRLLVLTGAGVSAESGLATFRGAGGLWEGHAVEDVATPEGFRADPRLVWRFYSQRRAQAAKAQPNPGHRALALVEQRLGDRFLLVTQNVDELHRRAGSRRLIEIHGRLFQSRCAHCDRPPFDDGRLYDGDEPPLCDTCDQAGRMGLLRPHIVWFGEMLDMRHFEAIDAFLAHGRGSRLVFLAVGTSGVVYPAAALVDLARAAGAETWLVNAEPAENLGRFQRFVLGPSGRVLPELFGLA
jgi:NAD-dependent protein deacetylase/lipoamidase